MYGYETWSLTLREEHRLRVSETRVLSKIFVPKREEVVGGWRKLHHKERHKLCTSENVSGVMKSMRMK
jgi:hypothetical protein